MINMLSTASSLDLKGWMLGSVGALISGGAGAIGGGFGAMVEDPEHFNVGGGGLHHLLVMMGITFLISGIISLAKFLQVHPVPDQLQQAVDKAAEEADKAKVQSAKAADAVAKVQDAVPPKL